MLPEGQLTLKTWSRAENALPDAFPGLKSFAQLLTWRGRETMRL